MIISVTVKTLDGQNHLIENLDDSISIGDFKVQISPKVGIAAETQRLIYCGRVLQDEKKLSDYNLNQKVLHLVQRLPPTQTGSDRMASGPEPRGRSISPNLRPGMGRSPFLQIRPSQPSMSVRLSLAGDMISRANALLEILENPNRETSSDASNTTNGASANTPSAESGSTATGGSSSLPSSGRSSSFGMAHDHLIPSLSQAVSAAISSALNSMSSHGNVGVHGMAFTVNEDGVVMPSPLDNFDDFMPGSGRVPRADTPTVAPGSASTSQPTTPPGATSASVSAPTGAPQRHPAPPALADMMRSYRELSRRIQPFWDQVENNLQNDDTLVVPSMDPQRTQVMFMRVTEVMHLMSHAMHALSDAVVNYSRPPPREVRARPFIFQSAIVQTASGSAGPSVASQTNTGANRATTGTPTSTAGTPTSSAGTSTPTVPPTGARLGATGMPQTHGGVPPMRRSQSGSLHLFSPPETSFGIELGGSEITINATTSGLLNMTNGNVISRIVDAAINNARLAGRLGPLTTATTPTTTTATVTSATSTSQSSSTTSQASGAAPNTTTTPNPSTTTTTRTRVSAHVHYNPMTMPAMGPPPSMSRFDPFLPCQSHHLPSDRSRNVIIGGRRGTIRTSRSSSVPPPAATGSSERASSSSAASPSSARSTPMPSPTRHINLPRDSLDFGSMPIFGTIEISEPHQTHPIHNPSRLNPPIPSIEPSLANFIMQLNEVPSANSDQNMSTLIQGILQQVGRVFSNRDPNAPSPTLADFLNTLPDYNYQENVSLLNDFIMDVARVMNFRDMLNFVFGSPDAFANLQAPMRNFIRRRLMLNGTITIENALIKLMDENFPILEELSTSAAVNEEYDLPETLNKFLLERGLALCLCILNCPEDQFPERFDTMSHETLAQLTKLCLLMCTDGPASLERMVQTILMSINGDVAGVVREWTMSSAIGHLRNYIATQDISNASGLEGYIVKANSAEARVKKSDRAERANQRPQAEQVSSMEDDDTFLTPRSSPERMEVEFREQIDFASQSEDIPPLPRADVALNFPEELLSSNAGRTDMVVGHEAWHRAFPPDWVPIIARDMQRQADQSQEQAPFSDAYLSTQPSKRRRVISAGKPEGSVDRVIAETLQDAIQAADVQPLSAVEHVIRDASASQDLAQAVEIETRKVAKHRLDKDEDFSQIGEKFPHAKSFARK